MKSFTDPIMNTIQNRTSIRTFQPNSFSSEDTGRFSSLLDHPTPTNPFLPQGGNIRFKWIFLENVLPDQREEYGTYGFITGADAFLAGASTRALYTKENFGFQMESLILKAQELQFGTCWLGGTFSRSNFATLFNLEPEERLLAITPIGIPRVKGRRLKEKVIRGFIRADSRKHWNKLFFDGSFEHPLNPEIVSTSLKTLLEAVRLAPSGGNKQPWRLLVDLENNDVHFFQLATKSNSGYSRIRPIDMGIAVCHFELVRLENEIGGTWKIFSNPPSPDPSLQLRYVISWHAHSDEIFH